jgi:hypothetical protein
MLRDVEMNYAAPAVSQDHQPKQDSKGSRGDSEEIHRNQVIGMIVEEGLPGLGRQFRLLRKQRDTERSEIGIPSFGSSHECGVLPTTGWLQPAS